MQETKLVILLKKFEPEAIKSLGKFLKSPYFNTNPTIIKLWNHLEKYAPQFESNQLSQEKTYKKLFPKETFKEKKLRQLRSRLLKLVEEFLAIESFRQNEFEVNSTIANAYRAKGMKDDFEKRYESLKTNFSSEAFLPSAVLHKKLTIHHQLFFSELYVKGDKYPQNLAVSTRLLEKYYTQQKLLYTIEWLSSKLRYKHEVPQSIVSYAKSLQANPAIEFADTIQSIFENCVKLLLLEEKSAEFFMALKKQFTRNYTKINASRKTLLLRLLINFCVNEENKGKKTTEKTFQLYQLGLSDGAIFYKGLMTNVTLVNIVSLALKLKQFQWAKAFIDEEKYRLYEPQKEEYLLLTKASILYYEEKFQDCLLVLSTMKNIDFITLELIKRNLKIRAIFECYLRNSIHVKMLYANIENYSKYSQRKTILSINKSKVAQNFAKYILQVVNWREKQGTVLELSKIQKALIKVEPFPNKLKDWLLCHIDMLLC